MNFEYRRFWIIIMGYPELSSYTIERPLERKRHYSKLFNVYDSFTRLTVLASLVLTHLYGRRSSGSSQLDHAPEDREEDRKPSVPLPPLCGGGQRNDGSGPLFRGRCAPLSSFQAWAGSILHPDPAVCCHQRGIPYAKQLELAYQTVCGRLSITRVTGSLATTGAGPVWHAAEIQPVQKS